MISVASLTLKVTVLSTAHRKNDKSESFLLCRNINSNGLQMYSVLQELLECMHLAAAACKPQLKEQYCRKKTYEPITVYGLAYESNQIELILPNKSGPIKASLRD